jgi:hypothetical protein
MEIEQIANEKLDQLAKNPNNIVYRYVDQEAPSAIMPLSEVKDHILQLWGEFKQLKQNKELTYPQVRKLQKKICLQNTKWANFSKSHPLIFDRIVDHRTGEAEIKALLYMLFLKDMENKGTIQDGQQRLQSYIMDSFSMPEEEYRAQNKDANIIDPSKENT